MRSLRHIAPQSNSSIYPPLPQGAYIRGQQRRTRKILELPEAEQSAAIAKEKEEKKVPADFTISAFLTFLTPAPQAANDRDKAQRIQLVKAHMRLFCSTKCFLRWDFTNTGSEKWPFFFGRTTHKNAGAGGSNELPGV